jgi:tRNA(Ile2) C34 agmatinyltransferase TiaS
MLVYQERIGLLILGGVICACILSGILLDDHRDLLFTPYQHTLPDGTAIVITATVDTISKTATGEHLVISLKDEFENSIPLQIFIPNSVARQVNISSGDHVTAYGSLTTYRNQREIVISSVRDLSIAHNAGF